MVNNCWNALKWPMCSAIFKNFSENPLPPEELLLSSPTLKLGNILYCEKIPLAVLKNEVNVLDVEKVVLGVEYF